VPSPALVVPGAALPAGSTRVQAARTQAGLTQAALAEASGLSRQAVGAIEAGRHRPGVDAALGLARVLGVPVEELFGTPPPAQSASVLGEPVAEDGPVVMARVGNRRVHAPADLAGGQERWPVADGRWTDGEARPFTSGDGHEDGLVVVGCDPALGLLTAQLPPAGPRRMVAVSGSTRAALAAMTAGRAHAALVHGRPGKLPPTPVGVLRLHMTRWRVGLATRTGHALSLTDLAGRRAGIVQREEGASSQQALLRALRAQGCAPADGPIAGGHLAVAQRVVAGARAGVTIEPAAVHHHLGFHPLEEHVVQLWIAPEHREHPAVQELGGVLTSRIFQSRLAAIGGYDLTGCGTSIQKLP